MVVRTCRTGGFLYRTAVETTLDDSCLTPPNQAELQRLVSAADLASGGGVSAEARDARSVRLTVETNSDRREVAFDDLDPNPARHDLVAFVAEHGEPAPKG